MSTTIPAEGSRAPAFSATAHDGRTVSLDEFSGKRHVLLYFYPKADTPG